MNWFLYDRDLRHEKVNMVIIVSFLFKMLYQPKFGYMTMLQSWTLNTKNIYKLY